MTAQTELTVEERNEGIVRRFIREIANGDNYDLADELFAEGYVRHDSTIRERKRGPEGFRETVEAFRSALPDVEMTLHEVLCDGEFAFRATETGTHEGEFMGIKPTGRGVEMEGNVIHPRTGRSRKPGHSSIHSACSNSSTRSSYPDSGL